MSGALSLSPEIIPVSHKIVDCDGGLGALGHPRVFLAVDNDNGASCPYCSRRFVHDLSIIDLLHLLDAAEKSGDVEEAERLSRLLEKNRKGKLS